MGTPLHRVTRPRALFPSGPGSRLGPRLRPAMGGISTPANGGAHHDQPIRRHPPPAADRGKRGGARRRGVRRQRDAHREPGEPGAVHGVESRPATPPRRARPPARSTCSTPTTRPPRHGRRLRDHGRLAGGDPVQPVLPDPGDRGERRVGDLVEPCHAHPRLQVRARPRGRHPDARQRRRQGPGRQRRRDDRDLEAPRRPQVVRWQGHDLRRLQVRVGMGHGPGQRRRHHLGVRRPHGLGLPVRDRHGPPLQERLRGLPPDGGRPAAARLPVPAPGRGPGQGRRLPAGRDREPPHERRVQVRVGDARAPRSGSRATSSTRAGSPASPPTSTRSCSSGTAIRTR